MKIKPKACGTISIFTTNTTNAAKIYKTATAGTNLPATVEMRLMPPTNTAAANTAKAMPVKNRSTPKASSIAADTS